MLGPYLVPGGFIWSNLCSKMQLCGRFANCEESTRYRELGH
jgi:hypothetical protein